VAFGRRAFFCFDVLELITRVGAILAAAVTHTGNR
jgi:hypothetical protein